MNRIRIVTVSALSLAALAGGTACSSSGGSGTPTPSDSTTAGVASAPSTDPATAGGSGAATGSGSGEATGSGGSGSRGSGSGSGSDGSGSGGSGSGGSGTSQCAESQLRENVTADDIPGLDRHVLRVTLTNTSGSTCTLTGYPGAAVVDSSGKQVVQAKRVVGGPVGGTVEKVGTISVRPGATAYAYLEGTSTREVGAAQAGCDAAKYPRILVTPPNTRTPVPFTIGWPQCYSFEIYPVRMDA